jgi:exopolysaccharide biosynthesis polyprenyl glycosylphosphotransferase
VSVREASWPTADAQLSEALAREARRGVRRAASVQRDQLVGRMLQIADVGGLLLAFLVSQRLFSGGGTPMETRGVLLLLPVWVAVAKLYRLYDRDQLRFEHSTVDELSGVVHMTLVASWLSFGLIWALGSAEPSLSQVLRFWLVTVSLIICGRCLARTLMRRSPMYPQRVVIVGADGAGRTIAQKLDRHREYGVRVVGFVDSEPMEQPPTEGDLPLLGSTDRLAEIVHRSGADRVLVALSHDSEEEQVRVLRPLMDLDVQIDIVPQVSEVLGPRTFLHTLEGTVLLGLPPHRLAPGAWVLKRVTDAVLSAVALVVLAPLFAIISLAVKLDSPGPVFFRQVRMGRRDRPFSICKFRTMIADADRLKSSVERLNMHAQVGGDPRMFKIPDDPRCTRVGTILRRLSLDELPQLVNVLKGEMSLVGPRPLILEEDRYVAGWARRRLDLKPGITGPWQALGASSIPFADMVVLDYQYVTHWSMLNDLKWIWRTVPSLFRRQVS